MVYCNYCKSETDVEVDDANGFSCCVQCGSVLDDIAFSADVTFQKDAAGESTVVGQFVNESGVARGIGRIHGGRVYAYQADSHERAQQRGRQDIAHLVDILSVRPREESIESAHRLYKLALQRGFTRGRRTNQVAAACLYLVCRQDAKPFLLIDFSDALQVNVFTLGAVFLQLAKLLRLEEHPLFSKPVDPTLYIHRFADRLDFDPVDMRKVALTACRLVASMKRDWIQTGRRPSGICGAALYIAAHTHGFRRTKRDVVGVVHIGEHTLAKRLSEFAATDAGALTIGDFEDRAKELEAREVDALEAAPAGAQPASMIAGCEHLGHGEEHFSHGMCRACYIEFVKVSGGMNDGANPPAFSRNRAKEAKRAALLALPGPSEEEEDAGDAITEEEILLLEGIEVEAVGQAPARPRRSAGRTAAQATRSRTKGGAPTAAAAAEDAAVGGQRGGASPAVPEGRSSDGVTAETVAAAEAQVEAFAAAIEEAEAQEQRKRGRRRVHSGAVIAAVTARAVADAARTTAGAHEEEATAAAGAIIVAPGGGAHSELPVAAAGDFPATQGSGGAASQALMAVQQQQQQQEQPGEEEEEKEEEDQTGNLSEISDTEIDMYLAGPAEVACKEELWTLMNQDWVEKQAAKKAAMEAAERAQAEQRAAMEAAAAAGIAYKRGRGRPLGSKTKPKPEVNLPPAETPQEAAMRMLDNRKLSSKINYSVLADLFAEETPATEAAAATGGSGAAGASAAGPGAATATEARTATGLDAPSAAPSEPQQQQQEQPVSPRRRQQQQQQQQQQQRKRPQPDAAQPAPAPMPRLDAPAGAAPRRLGGLKDAFKGSLGGMAGGLQAAPKRGNGPGGSSKKVRFSEGGTS